MMGRHDSCTVRNLQLVSKQFRDEYEGEVGKDGTLELFVDQHGCTRRPFQSTIKQHLETSLAKAPVL